MILPRNVQLPRPEDALNLVARQFYGNRRWYVLPRHPLENFEADIVIVAVMTVVADAARRTGPDGDGGS